MRKIFVFFILFFSFLFFSCSNGASGGDLMDNLTADGDYYHDSNSGGGININLGDSGLGWVTNGYAGSGNSSNINTGGAAGNNSSSAVSNMSQDEFIRLNTARSQIDEENYKGALNLLEKLISEYPDNEEAIKLYRKLKRFMELEQLIPAKKLELEKLEKEINDLLIKIENQRKVVELAKEAMDKVYADYCNLKKQLDDKNEELNNASNKVQQLQTAWENETDAVEKQKLLEQLNAAKADYDKLLKERNDLKDKVDEAYQAYLAAKDKYEAELKTLQQLIDEYNAKVERYDALMKELKELESEYETIKTWLKQIKYFSNGLVDYSYSMRWIVYKDTSAYSAYQDIVRFIYSLDEYGDAEYAIVGKFGDRVFDESNYGIISLRYKKNPSNKSPVQSPYYATYGGTSVSYWDNIPVSVPQAIIGSGGATVYNASYTTDMIEVTLKDMMGNVINQKSYPYNVYVCTGGSGTAFDLFKSRITAYEETVASTKFPETNVTLFARSNRIKK